MKRALVFLCALILIALASLFVLPEVQPDTMLEPGIEVGDGGKTSITSRLSELRFVENRGQYPSSIVFGMRYAEGSVGFGRHSIMLSSRHPAQKQSSGTIETNGRFGFGSRKRTADLDIHPLAEPQVDRLLIDWPGSRTGSHPEGLDERIEKSCFFFGADPDKWRTDVRTYDRLLYRDLYPGIDLVFGEGGNALKTDFIVHPGADPDAIRIRYSGAENLWIDEDGNLIVRYGSSLLIEERPVAFQTLRGEKIRRSVTYRVESPFIVAFEIDEYDRSASLVIDPLYCTLLGGSGIDAISSVIPGTDGMLRVAGITYSEDFPLSGTSFQRDSGGDADGFISILDPASGTILNSTYYGGFDSEAMQIAVDSAGRIIAVGTTRSSNLPLAGTPLQARLAGSMDLFVAIFDSSASRLLAATYFGGSGFDDDFGWTMGPNGEVIITGLTDSRNFPTTPGAYQRSYAGGEDDVFVSCISKDCSRIIFSTFIGGSAYDEGYGVGLDKDENVYVTGYTNSYNFPVTANAIQASKNPYDEGFIAKLDPTGSTLLYGTYFGGDVYDLVENVVVDSAGVVFVLGRTTSNDLPVTAGVVQSAKGDSLNPNPYLSDLFVMRLSDELTRIDACTYLGGTDSEYSRLFLVYDANTLLIVSATESPDYPTIGFEPDKFQGTLDVVYSVISKSFDRLYFSEYFGGDAREQGLSQT